MILCALRLERPLTLKETERFAALLDKERLERLERISRVERRREPLCAWALLLWMLRRRYGWQAMPQIERGVQGKPFFPAYPTVHFNLSHTDGAVLAGVDTRALGVDIERIRPMAERSLQRLGGEAETFFPCWVRREARAKVQGIRMNELLRGEMPLRPEEQYVPLDTFPGYAAGAAAWGTPFPGQVECCTLDQLSRALE